MPRYKWEIPNSLSSSASDIVELELKYTGKEVVRLNGHIVSNKFGLLKSRHAFQLKDGRSAEIRIFADMKHSGRPACELNVNNVQIAMVTDQPGEHAKHVVVARRIPKKNALWLLGFVIFFGAAQVANQTRQESWITSFLIAIAIVCAVRGMKFLFVSK